MRAGLCSLAVVVLAGVAMADAESQACTWGKVPLEEFVVTEGLSENLKHLSLDGAPEIPSEGVRIPVTCTIDKDGAFQSCVAACAEMGAGAVSRFLPVVLRRASAIRVAPTNRSGGATAGATTTVVWTIEPNDRFTAAPVDLTRGDQLVFAQEPQRMDLARFYPWPALGREMEAALDIACVVRSDLAVDCPHIVVRLASGADEELKAAFEDAGRRIARLFKLAPTTKDGKSAVGTWFRKRIRFKIA